MTRHQAEEIKTTSPEELRAIAAAKKAIGAKLGLFAPQTPQGEAKTENPVSAPQGDETLSSWLPIEKKALQESNTSLDDIPDDVKKNLVGYADMELDDRLLSILGARVNAVDADHLILILWREHRMNPARAKLLARLRRLADRGLIEKVPGARSQYKIVSNHPGS